VYWLLYFRATIRCRTFIAPERRLYVYRDLLDERAAVPGSTSEPMIPYSELSGEELTVWQEYLPMRER
jgi:hypothetical protein